MKLKRNFVCKKQRSTARNKSAPFTSNQSMGSFTKNHIKRCCFSSSLAHSPIFKVILKFLRVENSIRGFSFMKKENRKHTRDKWLLALRHPRFRKHTHDVEGTFLKIYIGKSVWVRKIICFQGSRGRMGKFAVKKKAERFQSPNLFHYFHPPARVLHFISFLCCFQLLSELAATYPDMNLSYQSPPAPEKWMKWFLEKFNCKRNNCYRFKCRRSACALNLHSFTNSHSSNKKKLRLK